MIHTTEQILVHLNSCKETNHQLLREFVSGLYKDNTAEEFSNSLNKMAIDLSNLVELFNLIIAFEPKSRYDYRRAIIKFLLASNDIKKKLEFIHTQCLFLFDNENELISDMRFNLFSYCFQMRHEGQFDIELYSVIYSILKDLNMSSDVWTKEINSCDIVKFWQDVYQCDFILENNKIQPHKYEIYAKQLKIIPETSVNRLSIQIRLELYDTIYPYKLISYAFPDRISNLSGETKLLLKYISKCPLLFEFETDIETLVLSLWHSEEINIESMSDRFEDYIELFKTISDVDTVLREFCLMISIAPPGFITQLTLCLLLLTSAFDSNDYLELCKSSWLRAYITLLDQAQFEDPRIVLFQESIIIQALFKLASCFMMYQVHVEPSDVDLNTIWEHYDLQRSLYLKSIQQQQNEQDESIIEKILFTSILQ